MKYPDIFLYIACWLVWINLATFVAFKWDKQKSIKKEWRIRESTLLNLALFGGSPAAIAAQKILRHKTRKEPFRSQLRIICIFQIVLGVGMAMAFSLPATRAFFSEQLELFQFAFAIWTNAPLPK